MPERTVAARTSGPGSEVIRFPPREGSGGRAANAVVRTAQHFCQLFDESMGMASEAGRVLKRLDSSILILKACVSPGEIDTVPGTGKPELAKLAMKFNAMVMVSSNPAYSQWVPSLSMMETGDALKQILTFDISSPLTIQQTKRELGIQFESDPPGAGPGLERIQSMMGHNTDSLNIIDFQLNSLRMFLAAEFQAAHAERMVRCVCGVVANIASRTSCLSRFRFSLAT